MFLPTLLTLTNLQCLPHFLTSTIKVRNLSCIIVNNKMINSLSTCIFSRILAETCFILLELEIFTVTVQHIHCFPEEPAADQMAWFKHFFGWFKSQNLYRNVQGNPNVSCSKLPLPSYHEN